MQNMRLEILEQPDWMDYVIEAEQEKVFALADAIRDRDIRYVLIAARGTSDNAATYAKYLFEILTGMPVALAAPSVFTLYDAHLNLSNTLAMGISQSGQATDVVQVLSAARSAGALTACLTNNADSPITRVSDHSLLCHAGEERSVAATKTYTTALALVAMLVGHLSGNRNIMDGLKTISDKMRQVLKMEEKISRSMERFRYMEECAVLARGINLATAQEAALKMTETSYVVARPFSGADFLHGPVAMLHEGFPCFLYAPNDQSYSFMLELALRIREAGGEMVITAESKEIGKLGTQFMQLPVSCNEYLTPILYILPAQLMAYHLAKIRGEDPDSPRGLTKITQTR
jgi:glucosamine--fructose-6-phosphate aminotransferase (isomerizing)